MARSARQRLGAILRGCGRAEVQMRLAITPPEQHHGAIPSASARCWQRRRARGCARHVVPTSFQRGPRWVSRQQGSVGVAAIPCHSVGLLRADKCCHGSSRLPGEHRSYPPRLVTSVPLCARGLMFLKSLPDADGRPALPARGRAPALCIRVAGLHAWVVSIIARSATMRGPTMMVMIPGT